MFLAQASASGTGAMASLLIPLVIFFVLMYFMIMRPQKKEQHPSENQEKVLQAVANTFCENMNAETITIKADGQTLAEGLSFEDAGK